MIFVYVRFCFKGKAEKNRTDTFAAIFSMGSEGNFAGYSMFNPCSLLVVRKRFIAIHLSAAGVRFTGSSPIEFFLRHLQWSPQRKLSIFKALTFFVQNDDLMICWEYEDLSLMPMWVWKWLETPSLGHVHWTSRGSNCLWTKTTLTMTWLPGCVETSFGGLESTGKLGVFWVPLGC